LKKKIAAIAAALFVFASIEAFSFGLGLRAGYGWGGFGGGGLLFSPNSQLHFGGNYYIGSGGFYLGVTGDYWVIDKELTSIGRGTLDFYAGAGLFADIGIFDDPKLGAGIRIPIGLDFDFDVVDIFIEVAPQLGLSFLPGIGLWGSWLGGAIGARFWID
jgi:hypothetical protein